MRLPPALAAKLQALDLQFRTGLRQRLHEACANDPDLAHAALHRLVGAAGAYGHTALASHARQAMDAITSGQDSLHRTAMRQVRAEIERLQD